MTQTHAFAVQLLYIRADSLPEQAHQPFYLYTWPTPVFSGEGVHAEHLDMFIDGVLIPVRFLVNGTEVTSVDAAKVDTAGTPGLRVNHNLNLHVEGFAVKAR